MKWQGIAVFLLASHALLGQSNAANVLANGSVTVASKAVSHSTTIFDGEWLKSEHHGAAVLTAQDVTVNSSGLSHYKYFPKQLDLECGSVLVTTFNGYAVLAHGIHVTPTQPQAKYQVLQDNDRLRVQSLEGNLKVVDGQNNEYTLTTNNFKDFKDDAHCPVVAVPWIPVGAFSATALSFLFYDDDTNPLSPSKP